MDLLQSSFLIHPTMHWTQISPTCHLGLKSTLYTAATARFITIDLMKPLRALKSSVPTHVPSLHSIFLPPYLCSYHYPHCSTPTPHPQQFKAYSSKFSRYLQILEPSKVPVRRKLSCNFHSHTSPFNKYYQAHSKHSINMFKRITGAKMEA